jgi:glucosamine--fructose-6-phosphate aminotransferase (isomerizing)
MQGMAGYVGRRSALPILLDELKRLECRGYARTVIAYQNGHGLESCKTWEEAARLQSAFSLSLPESRVGIGYTERGADDNTRSPLDAAAHHEEGMRAVCIGTVDTAENLRSLLPVKGSAWQSPADTELMATFIAGLLQGGIPVRDAIEKTVAMLPGRYALAFLFENIPETIYLIKNGSPLVAALGDNEVFFGSNMLSVFPYTRKFVFPEDGQICRLRWNGFEVMQNHSVREMSPEGDKREVGPGVSPVEKAENADLLLEEIHEQPKAVMDTIGDWIDDSDGLLEELGLKRNLQRVRRLHIVGCGSSYHAGLVGRYIIEKFVHIPVNIDISSEYVCMRPNITKGTYFVALSQSGETADTVAAQRDARNKGAFVLSVCNVAGSTSTREADTVLYTRAGCEQGGASTKVFAAQLAALCLLGIALGEKRGTLNEVEVETLKSLLLNLPGLIVRALANEEKVGDIARRLSRSHGFVYLGRGINYPVAKEGALKMMELSSVHAEGYPIGELKFGPLALIGDGVPVIFVSPIESLDDEILREITKVKAMGGRVVVVTDSPASVSKVADEMLVVPPTHPALMPFLTVIPLQLLGHHVGRIKDGQREGQPGRAKMTIGIH